MKTNALVVVSVLLLLLVFTVACTSAPPTPTPLPSFTPAQTFTPSPTQTPAPTSTPVPSPTWEPTRTPMPPTSTPLPTPTKLTSERYQSAFGIDYGHPEKYLAQGEQTRLMNPQVINSLRGKPPSVAYLGEIYFWIQREFKPWSAGGATIGQVTVDQLFTQRKLGGCHDWGLVYVAMVRDLGYPAVMIDTAGISWAKGFRAGQKSPYLGHVFVEVFVGGKWVLVDSTNNWYVSDNYNPADGIIPLKMGDETEGLFVMRKGVDTWGYGIHSNAELQRLMDESARQLKPETIVFPQYNFQRFK